jgi:hypothetical protein
MVDRDRTSSSVMASTLRSIPAQAQSSLFASRHARGLPPTGIAPVCLWLLTLTVALGPGAFTAPLASVSVVSAVLLVGALRSSAVARQLAGIDPAVIGPPGPYGLPATASRTRCGRAYAPKRLSAR